MKDLIQAKVLTITPLTDLERQVLEPLTEVQKELLRVIEVRQRHLLRRAVLPTPVADCPACESKSLHSRQDLFMYHPHAKSGSRTT